MTARRVATMVGVALIAFSSVITVGDEGGASPPGTRRAAIERRLRRVPRWVCVAVVLLGIALVALGEL